MADKFQDKYRIPSARAGWWDYGNDAAYFVTINADNLKNHYFGQIQNGEIQLSSIGRIARDMWLEIPSIFPFVTMDVFVIMPNHVHGIIIINKTGNITETGQINQPPRTDEQTQSNEQTAYVQTRLIASLPGQPPPHDQTRLIASLQPPPNQQPPPVQTRLIASLPDQPQKPPGGITGKHNPMLGTGLGRIIRWYKGRVTFESRKIDPLFAWQARYHDHIIRNDDSYYRIKKYIINNPANWPDDKFYSA